MARKKVYRRGGKSGNQTAPNLAGTRIEHKVFADPEMRFGPYAFESQIGKVIPFKFVGNTSYHCKVISAVVADDGSYVTFVVEVQ